MPVNRPRESVWDYPRPPSMERDDRVVVVMHGGVRIAESAHTIRVLETSHPPVFYLPPDAVVLSMMRRTPHRTYCEWKGRADYWDVVADPAIERVAWSYPHPARGFEAIADWLAFYPSKVRCFVDGDAVEAQAGDFYGGWVTSEIDGPFKGGPGTSNW